MSINRNTLYKVPPYSSDLAWSDAIALRGSQADPIGLPNLSFNTVNIAHDDHRMMWSLDLLVTSL